jgi:ankyrin repeat protein
MSSTEPSNQENIHNFVSNRGGPKNLYNMRKLLSEGKITNINVSDKTPDDNNKIHNHTALMVQAGWSDTLMVMKLLLGKDPQFKLTDLNITPANPNLKDKNGYTALHLAIIGGKKSYEKVKLLLESGADKNIKSVKSSSEGEKPLELVKRTYSTQDKERKKIIKSSSEGETPLELVKRTYSTQDKEGKKIIELLTEPLFTEKSSKSSKSLSNGGTNRNKSKKTHNKFFGRTRKQNVIKMSTSKNPIQREK